MPTTWTCETCNKVFSRRGDLLRHHNLHTGIKPYKCEECGKCFSQLTGLKTHGNIHTGAKPYRCVIPDCDAAFGDPSSRARHVKETHRTSGGYQCPVLECRSRIKRTSAFNAHLRTRHQINPKTIDLTMIAPEVLPSKARAKRRNKVKEVPSIEIDRQESMDFLSPLLDPQQESTSPWAPSPFFQPHEAALYPGIWYSAEHPQAAVSDTFDSSLYTMECPISTPPLSYSQSPSPAPSNDPFIPSHRNVLLSESLSPVPIAYSFYTDSVRASRTLSPHHNFPSASLCYDLPSVKSDHSWEAIFFGDATSGQVDHL